MRNDSAMGDINATLLLDKWRELSSIHGYNYTETGVISVRRWPFWPIFMDFLPSLFLAIGITGAALTTLAYLQNRNKGWINKIMFYGSNHIDCFFLPFCTDRIRPKVTLLKCSTEFLIKNLHPHFRDDFNVHNCRKQFA